MVLGFTLEFSAKAWHCMHVSCIEQTGCYNMFGTHFPAGLYLMRWVQASSGHLMLYLESTESPKPCSMPTGHNTGLLSKVISALGSPEAMQQYAKIFREKY